jgi:hypothetical protein
MYFNLIIVPTSSSGLVYLIRFFGYFSTVLSHEKIINKSQIRTFLQQMFVNIIRKLFFYLESCRELEELHEFVENSIFMDICDSLALLSEGM